MRRKKSVARAGRAGSIGIRVADFRRIRKTKNMDAYQQFLHRADVLEREHPGETIVLNAQDFKVIAISKDPKKIAKKLRALNSGIQTIFIGGPRREEVACHHFCAPQ